MIRRAALLGAVALLVGCRPSLDRLEIQGIRDVRVLALGPEGATLGARVGIRNPGRAAARVTALDLRAALGGAWLAQGGSAAPVDMPARGVGEFDLRLQVAWNQVTPADLDALLEPGIPYRLEGRASIDRPVRMDAIPVRAQGRYRAPGPARVALPAGTLGGASGLVRLGPARLTNLGFTRQEGEVELGVENPLAFEVPVLRLDYALEAGGTPLAEGSVHHLRLKPGPNRLKLPVRVSLLGAAAGLAANLLQGRSGALAARGTLAVGGPERHLDLEWTCGDP